MHVKKGSDVKLVDDGTLDYWRSLGYEPFETGDLVIAPAFAPNTQYTAGQLVWQAGALYRAKVDFAAGGSFSAGDWDSVGSAASATGPLYEYSFGSAAAETYLVLNGCNALNGGPLVTPSQADWDSLVGDGRTTGAVPALTAGTYLVAASQASASGDTAGLQVTCWAGGEIVAVVYSPQAPVQKPPAWIQVPADGFLAVEVDATNADPTRNVNINIFVQKIADFS